MVEIGFYHLTVTPLERALPRLLEKTLEAGERAVVVAGSPERVKALNDHLWTYDDSSWLPHGSEKDGMEVDQLIWLTDGTDVPNGARFLFLTDGQDNEAVGDYDRVFDLFDGRDDLAVQAARERWKARKDAGLSLTYWRQTDRGGWEKAG